MKLMRRIQYLLRQRKVDADLAEELEFHRSMNSDPRAMGNVTLAREDARAVWIWPWLQSVWQDIAYALRSLRRQPAFTLIALGALGTAIGLNTSFFTVFNGIALRPWPVKDPAQVVKVFGFDPRHPNQGGGVGVAEYRYFADHARSFSGLGMTWSDGVHFGFEPFAHSSNAVFVGGDYFRVLGVGMHLGRGFLPEEDRLEAPEPVAALSYPYWRDHFGSDPAIVGKQVPMDEIPFIVVGVTPEDFTGTADGGGREDVYMPLPAMMLLHPTERWVRDVLTKPDQCCRPLWGRLAPGISRAQAAAEIKVMDRQFRSQFSLSGTPDFGVTDSALMSGPGKKTEGKPIFALMFLGVTLVVLLACANVGNLLIARAGARQKEIEVRRAIGASRSRIIRQLMTESLLIALGAAALGLPIAYWLPSFIIGQTGEALSLRLTPDGTVLAYAAALSLLTCLAFGLAPAFHGTRPAAQSRLPLRNLLLAAQVMLSVILLIGAGLALQGVARLRTQNPGFAIDGVSVVSFELPARSSDATHAQDFDRSLLNALGSEGKAFGITAREPLSNNRWLTGLRPFGQPESSSRPIEIQEVTAGYFDILHIPVIAGRNFEPGDFGQSVILVNQTLARLFWNGEQAVGKAAVSAANLSGKFTYEVVGVVRDAYLSNLDRVEPTFYIPFRGTIIPKVLVGSEAAQAVSAMAGRVETRVRTQALPLESSVERWFRVARIGAEVAGMLGVFALILATVGMSGVFAFVVQQRTKEIGIRMALGARPAQVVRLVLGGSSRAVVIGLALGVGIALPAARLLRSVLYGVSPLNPIAYLSVACILAIAGIAASYVPARRASRIDPTIALRQD